MKIKGLISSQEMISSRNGSYLLLDEGRAYRRWPPSFLDDSENSEEDNRKLAEAFANEYCPAVPIRALFLSNAMVFGQGTVVISTGELLNNSAAEFINHNCPPDGFCFRDGELISDDEVSDATLCGISLLVKRPWYRNYGHFLVDLLPIIAIVKRERLVVDRLVFGDVAPGELRNMMEQAANHLFPKVEILFAADDRPLRFETLLYVEPVHVPPLYKNPVAIDLMVSVSKEMRKSDSFVCQPKIYVSRQKTAGRKILNDEELSKVLSLRGFEIVYPETLSFQGQMAVFSAAKIIIGAKGAALTTAAFCDPGTKILLLSPANFIDPFFWDLLSPRGIVYNEVFCEAQEGASISMRDIHVNLNKVEKWLDIVMA